MENKKPLGNLVAIRKYLAHDAAPLPLKEFRERDLPGLTKEDRAELGALAKAELRELGIIDENNVEIEADDQT
jgi:hypothetical protein